MVVFPIFLSEGNSCGEIRVVCTLSSVKTFSRANGLSLELPYKLRRHVVSRDRAQKPEEIEKMVELANLGDKIILLMLALGARIQDGIIYNRGISPLLLLYHLILACVRFSLRWLLSRYSCDLACVFRRSQQYCPDFFPQLK